MALTIGTDAYDTTTNVVAYWVDRGEDAWSALTETQVEVLIRKASEWIDRTFRFTGEQKSGDQRLAWPRTDVVINGHDVSDTTIPWQIKEATAIVADMYRVGTFDMEGVVTDDAAVTMEKVDVITIQYDATKRLQGGVIPTNVYQLLRALTGAVNGALLRA